MPSCPVILVVVVPKEGGKDFDIGRMAQNMMVAAHGLGLASRPVTFHHEDATAELLGVPDGYRAAMGVGHPAPAEATRQSSPRTPLDELVNWGRWAS